MSEKQQEAQEPQRQLIIAFRRVFGTDGQRTKAQRMVMDHLINSWGINKPSFIPNTDQVTKSDQLKRQVTYDPIKAALADGAKMPILQILQILAVKEDKPKPKVKK